MGDKDFLDALMGGAACTETRAERVLLAELARLRAENERMRAVVTVAAALIAYEDEGDSEQHCNWDAHFNALRDALKRYEKGE